MSRPWTVVLADDAAQTRSGLKALIEDEFDLKIVGEASDGPAALELLDRLRPDLALMRFHLPQLDGLDLLRSLRPRDWPLFVFYEDPTDDLDPRIAESRLEVVARPRDTDESRSLLRAAVGRLEAPRNGLRDDILGLLGALEPEGRLECLPIRHNGRIEVLDLDEVDWISAAGNYVELHCEGRRLLHRSALRTLEKRLDPARFLRIHRSTIVNVQRIVGMTPTPQGDFKLRLRNGEQVRLSRRFREAIDRLTARAELVERA